jgi:putative DNA primase/helicase
MTFQTAEELQAQLNEARASKSNGHALDDAVNPPGEPMPNVRRFLADKYAHDDRDLLIHQGGQFYDWDGTCWPTVEDAALVSAFYKWFEHKSFLNEKGEPKPFAPTVRKVTDLIGAAKGITNLPAYVETPSWLEDASHPADEVISCRNGLVHWPTRKLLDHTPQYYVHHSVPFAFDPKAPSPTLWLDFLNQLWPGDPESIATLQQIFGYLVSGDTRQHKAFMIVGPRRAGKGTIGRVLTRMIGRHNVAGPTLASLATNFGLQDLIGKPVGLISDARISSRTDGAIVTERLLSISGEDLQNVDRKYKEPWSGYLPTRFVILTNELPRLPDASGALAGRFVVLMLRNNFYGKEDLTLTDRLCEELPGIFNWALDGLQLLRARGKFRAPVASATALQDLEDLASPVGAFIREMCAIGPSNAIETEALWKMYQQWCLDEGHKSRDSSTFGKDLRAAAPEIEKRRPGNRGARAHIYVGICPKKRDGRCHDLYDAMWEQKVGKSCDTYDTDPGVTRVTPETDLSPAHCTACDGLGCPTCQPRAYGIGGSA